MRTALVFAVFLSLISARTFSQAITINARVDSTNLLIGDQILYSLELSKPVNEKIQLPFLHDSVGSGVEIVETFPLDTVFAQGNMHTLRQRYAITSFDTGSHVLPRQAFIWDHEGRSDTLFSNDVLINVFLVEIDTTQNTIKDIKSPYEAPFTWDEIIPYILWGLLALLVIAAAVYITWRVVHKKSIIPIPEKPKPKPHEVALQKLNELKERKLWQNNHVKKYHIELTEIIRQYIEDRFSIPALEQVSYEIINDCSKNKEIPEASVKALKKMLTIADLVKFAKLQPLPDENDNSLKDAFLFVESTIPVAVDEEKTEITNNENAERLTLKSDDNV